MTISLSTDLLEQRAAVQRQRLHDSVIELREHLDVQRTARTYLWRVAAVAALVAATLGYGVAGVFTD